MAPRTRRSRTTAWLTADNHTQDAFAENTPSIQADTHKISVTQHKTTRQKVNGTEPDANPPSKFIVASGQIYLSQYAGKKRTLPPQDTVIPTEAAEQAAPMAPHTDAPTKRARQDSMCLMTPATFVLT
jgi:hypothetical protein